MTTYTPCPGCGSTGRLHYFGCHSQHVRTKVEPTPTPVDPVRQAAEKLYLGEIGFQNPTHPDILALGVALYPSRARPTPPLDPGYTQCAAGPGYVHWTDADKCIICHPELKRR